MTNPAQRLAPRPLRDERELEALLRQANEAYASGLDEAAAYRRIHEQLATRAGSARSRFGARPAAGALLGGLAIAGAVVWLRAARELGPPIVLGPEDNVGARETPAHEAPAHERLPEAPTSARWAEETEAEEEAAAAAPSTRAREIEAARRDVIPGELPAQRVPAQRREDARPGSERAAPKRELAAANGENQRSEVDVGEPAAPERAIERTAAAEPELDCMQMARDGAPREAESCFVTLASGVGLRAEMALHEMARLRRDVLGDARGALAALSEYRQRFPRGSLRHEVALARVELLVRLGRARDALRESEELLASPDGRIRAAELHLLRGNMYQTALSDLEAAATEYARAERLGGALGAEATYLRGRCLETLGDRRAALEAYERYLSTPRAHRAAEVRRRVSALSRAARAAEPQP